MAKHVVLGAGSIGTGVAAQLLERGEEVIVVTRSGSGPDGTRRVAADVKDGSQLSQLAAGSAVIYNCLNPQYHQWHEEWPPMAAAILAAAKSSGAVLSVCSNLYGYGPVDGPILESLPLNGNAKGQLRAQMWRDALAAQVAGEIRMAEARGSDYIGAGRNSMLGDTVVPRLLAGKSAQVLGDIDNQHTFTYVEDMATTLIAIGADERAWGRAWHVPSDIPCTPREGVQHLAAAAGVAAPKISRLPWAAVSAIGIFNPLFREFKHTRYQWDSDFVMDSSAARSELGLSATPPDKVYTAVVAQYT